MTHDHSNNDKVEDWPIFFWVIVHCILFFTNLTFLILIWRFTINKQERFINIFKKHKPKLFLMISLHCSLFYSALGAFLSTNMVFPWHIQHWSHSTSQMIYYFTSIFFGLTKGIYFITYLYRIRVLYVFEARWKYYLIFIWEWLLYATILLSVVEQLLHACIVTTTKSSNIYICNFPSNARDVEVAETIVFITAILILFLYINKLKKVNKGDIKARKRTMYLLLKEAVLLLIPTMSSSALFISVIANDPQNMSDHIAIWFGPLDILVQCVCAFFMLRMNDRLYFNACHCCSLQLLKCCGMYEKGDERMLDIAKNADFGETPVPTQARVLRFADVPSFHAGGNSNSTDIHNDMMHRGGGAGDVNGNTASEHDEQDRFHLEIVGGADGGNIR